MTIILSHAFTFNVHLNAFGNKMSNAPQFVTHINIQADHNLLKFKNAIQ